MNDLELVSRLWVAGFRGFWKSLGPTVFQATSAQATYTQAGITPCV